MRLAKNRHLFSLFCKTSQFITFIILVCSAFIFVTTANAAYNIRDDATGGNCSSIGIWNWNTKTCTLTMDLADSILIDNDGITLDGANHQISGNNVGFGITIDYWKNIIVKNLKIKNFAYGIYISNSENNLITGNIVSDNSETGVVLLNSHGNLITENEISNNQVSGMEIWYVYAMSENKVYHNNFLNNGYQIYAMFDEGDFFYQNPPIGGNYWSNYDEPAEGCVDLNSDNICDSPYIFSDGQDNLPWIRQDAWLRIQLPQTGQTTCYDSAGVAIPCAGTGQDGDIQAGVPWPDLRFADNGDGTVTDNLTGLMWTRDANLPGNYTTWQEALDYVAGMNAGIYPNFGYTDWRLPNIVELESLSDMQRFSPTLSLGHPFINIQYSYWSSTTGECSYSYYGLNCLLSYLAYVYSIGYEGGIYWMQKSPFGDPNDPGDYWYGHSVWPVRSGRVGTIQLPQTGQTTCFDSIGTIISCAGTGQDGEIQAGVPWPNPRFIDNKDGTIIDNLTGLMWTKDANLMVTKDQWFDTDSISGDGAVTWQKALDYVDKLNSDKYLGYTDWRLPNRKELLSLINYGSIQSPSLIDYFINIIPSDYHYSGVYWSSTSYVPPTSWGIYHGYYYDGAWAVYILESSSDFQFKYGGFARVWPMRGGQIGDGTTLIDTDNDGYPDDQDCDPNNPTVNPGATEACNGIDDNCNNQIDDGCNINQPPVLNLIGDKSVDEGGNLTFSINGSDPDGNLLTYSATNLPAGVNFDPITQTFSWTPNYTQAGLYSVTFSVSDGNLTDSETVAITVNDICNPDTPEIPFDGIDQNCDGKDVTEFWAEIQNTPNGVWSLRDACGSVNKPYNDVKKELPNGWVIKVISNKNGCNNNDSYQWVEVEDTTDSTIGWMASEYLTYNPNNQGELEKRVIQQLTVREERVFEVVSNYYNNTNTTNSLYGTAGGRDGNNDFQKFIIESLFPKELILAITAEESGPQFDNEICASARDGGIGIMQITSRDFKGLGSGLNNYLKKNDCDSKYGWIGDRSKYYSNAIQGIYANIKDGFRVLQEKYKQAIRMIENPKIIAPCPLVIEGTELTCIDLKKILTVWGYNGFGKDENGQYSNYLGRIANKLKTLNSYFDAIINSNNEGEINELSKKLYLANNNKTLIKLNSPGELQILDSQGRTTGLINGEMREEIPLSAYVDEEKGVVIFFPNDTYTYKVIGTSEGTYGLTINSVEGGISTIFNAIDIPISINEIHTYSVDWAALANNERGVALNIDYEGDGIVDRTVTTGSELYDITPPQIIGPDLNQEYLFNSQVQIQFSATDDRSGVASITATLNGIQVANGETVILNKLGINRLEIIATDNAGNTNTLIKTFNVGYNFGGFLPPIKIDGNGIYKQGRTLPVKFQLTDINNNYISTATPYLFIAKISNGIAGSDEIPLSTSSADADNKFRYDQNSNQYIYNLSTNSMTAGTWQLKVALDDGKSYTVLISIKN